MCDIAIRVENLSKRYRIGLREQAPGTLRGAARSLLSAPFGYLKRMSRPPTEEETLWALRDVSFEVKHGEVLGIIGRNGAGKSTLLKILSRITEPSGGRAEVYGRVGSLLEVGTGFHPELTGRENIYLNGAILGMKRTEIDRKFDEIVDFSGVERFLDTPVKRYSSGMYVRLAFAVAAHLEPEILLVDEVLAVGDAAFQEKCLGKMEDISNRGKAVLFVSHNMGAIRGLCPRALYIDNGKILHDGDVESTLTNYIHTIFTRKSADTKEVSNSDQSIELTDVILKGSDGLSSSEFAPGERLTVEIHYRTHQPIYQPNIWIAVTNSKGPLFGAGTVFDGHTPDMIKGEGVVSCTFQYLPLIPQTYMVRLDVRSSDMRTYLIRNQEVAYFRVTGNLASLGLDGKTADLFASDAAPIMLPYQWNLPSGRTVTIEKTIWARSSHG